MNKYQPKHLRTDRDTRTSKRQQTSSSGADSPDAPAGDAEALPNTAHPLGIPVPDPGDGGEYVPIPGKGNTEHIAQNGAIIRNPWSEQPEILPDYRFTDEKEDMNLLIM